MNDNDINDANYPGSMPPGEHDFQILIVMFAISMIVCICSICGC